MLFSILPAALYYFFIPYRKDIEQVQDEIEEDTIGTTTEISEVKPLIQSEAQSSSSTYDEWNLE